MIYCESGHKLRGVQLFNFFYRDSELMQSEDNPYFSSGNEGHVLGKLHLMGIRCNHQLDSSQRKIDEVTSLLEKI